MSPVSQFLFLSLVISSATAAPVKSVRGPQQIHIAYGEFPSEMVIVWSTDNLTNLGLDTSFVHYGLAPYNYTLTAKGNYANLTHGNPNGLQFIHRVKLEVSDQKVKVSLSWMT